MPVDLLTSPRWQANHLGLPMPDDRDAVSACLPRWVDNIAYEEGEPRVIDALQAAYPRFCIHPDVRQLCEHLFPDAAGLPFISQAAAERAINYVQHCGGTSARLQPIDEQPCVGVRVSSDEFPLLKQYWQHAGELVSSRVARQLRTGDAVTFRETDARRIVRQRIARLHHVCEEQVFLYASGMGAIASAWRSVQSVLPDRPTCQFGFPYVDTLKVQERFPGQGCLLLPFGGEVDEGKMPSLFLEHSFSSVFCESPTNPLLATPNLEALRNLTRRHESILIVDDTLRACSENSLLPQCDIIVTSLTKYFSGYGNLLAGALVLNPAGSHFGRLQNALQSNFEETLSDTDTLVLEQNSRDVQERTHLCVKTARELVSRLQQHPAVADVFYPESKGSDTSSGALFSIVLKDAHRRTPAVFDQLPISKGPNLGTNFTLCCPYTILAHYTELDFAERCGASRWLLRFSVGVEPVEELWTRISSTLAAAT